MTRLQRVLNSLDVFAISSGAMISSGLFVLPAIAYLNTGPSVVLSYLIAAIIIIPAMFAKAELSTAMPKSGGSYFFIQRSMGSGAGTFAGMSAWLSLTLKSAFALVGIGIFLGPLLSSITGLSNTLSIKLVASFFAISFGILNILSTKNTGRFQLLLVIFLILILFTFIVFSLPYVDLNNFIPLAPKGTASIFVVSGMVFISFGGLTKIDSIAEEIKDPGKNIPLGMFASFSVVTLLYILVIFVTVGTLSRDIISQTLTPISDAAQVTIGTPGMVALSIAALIAFLTTGNAGILASSRYPMAMSKDNLIPGFFSKVNMRLKTPVISILGTVLFMITIILLIDLENLIKAASTMQLLLFAFTCLSVIIMRESGLVAYRPKFRSPFYPGIIITGFLIYIILIFSMGTFSIIVTGVVLIFSFLWFLMYTKRRVKKDSAIIHIAEKISRGKIKGGNLSHELKEILRERDNIEIDRFDRLIEQATVIDIKEEISRDELFEKIAIVFSKSLGEDKDYIIDLLKERESDSSTIIQPGLAIPHIVVEGSNKFDITVIRSRKGVNYAGTEKVKIFFAIAGSADERNFHLQVLMAIAQIVQNKTFNEQWDKAPNRDTLRNLILLADRVRKGRI